MDFNIRADTRVDVDVEEQTDEWTEIQIPLLRHDKEARFDGSGYHCCKETQAERKC